MRKRCGHSPTQGLRGGVDGDRPAVGDAPLVDPLAEVPDEEIAAHLQVGDGALEVFLPALAEAGLFAEELPVGHPTAAGDETPPLPGVLLLVAGPPGEVGGVLLHRETGCLIFKQRQETHLIDPADQFLSGPDAGGGVPAHAPHDPFAVFNRHNAIPFALASSIIT